MKKLAIILILIVSISVSIVLANKFENSSAYIWFIGILSGFLIGNLLLD